MKLVLLMYLKDDEKCVNRLLGQQAVLAFSRLSVEGHGPGSAAGWSGEIQPYESQVIMTVLPDDQADSLVGAVSECTGVEDPRHPIRAALLDVEQFTCCELAQS
ncbi:MAG: hypothetical protein JSV86_15575 [Gemmatimonadota bacterium]|nr:MAG: hypothetical protein JSV86_15575 [Gemmatimonadota bacterium]